MAVGMKTYKLHCEKCSKQSVPSNPLGLRVMMGFQFEVKRGPKCADGKHRPVQTYQCPSCGGRTAVQNDPGADVSTSLKQAQGLAGDANLGEITPTTWGARGKDGRQDGLPRNMAEVGVKREEVKLEKQKTVNAADFRKTLLGGDVAPVIAGVEVYFDTGVSKYSSAASCLGRGDYPGYATGLKEALAGFEAFVRFARPDDHRLAQARAMVVELKSMGAV